MTTRPKKSLTPSVLCEAAFRHKKKLIITPVVILLLATAVILWAPRTYQSEAKLFLQVGRESVGLDPTATTGQTISLQQNGRDAEIVSAMELLGSRGVISKAVDRIGPEYVLRGGPAGKATSASDKIVVRVMAPLVATFKMLKSIDPVSEREEAIIELEENLLIDSERDSTVIVVQYDAKTPVGAQHVLANLVEVYQQENLRVHRNPESQTFFAEQRNVLEQRLEDANTEVREAKDRMTLASIVDRRSTLEGQLRAVELEAFSTEQNLATAMARVSGLEKQLDALPERLIASRKSIPNEGADLLREQLYALQMREMDLKARYKESHPKVLAIAALVQEAEKVVSEQSEKREETTDDVNPIHRQLSLDLNQQRIMAAGYDARLEVLRDQKELVLNDLKQLNRNEVELNDLQREVTLAESKFAKYSENLEQARIDQALEDQRISSVSVAQQATLAEKPVSPSKLLVGLGALLLAFGTPLAWVAASEQFNDKVRSREDVEQRLSIPVLAEIPKSNVHGRVLNY